MSKIDISKLDKKQLKTLGKSIDDYEIPQEVYDEARDEDIDELIDSLGYTTKQISDEIDTQMATQGSEDYEKLKSIYHNIQDINKQIDELRDKASKSHPKELKKLEGLQNQIESDLRTQLLYFKPSNEDEQMFLDMVMLKIVNEAKGQRDDYGIPKGVLKKDEDMIVRITKKAVNEKLDEIFADKEVVKEMREKNIPQEKIDEFRKQLMDTGVGAITKMMLQVVGEKFQKPIRRLSNLFGGLVLRSPKFKKKGSSDETKQFYIKVQKQAQHLQSLDRYKMTHIIKKLADEHNKSEAYIKDIIYKDLSK